MDESITSEIVGQSKPKLYLYVGDFFNILKAFIGTNYQALPFAFNNSGVLCGVLGVLLIAALTDHCCQLMVRCKYYAIDQIIEDEAAKGTMSLAQLKAHRKKLGKTLGYGDIGQTVFGDWCYHLIQFAVLFTQFTTCTCYFIFIGETIYSMFPQTYVLIPLNNHTSNLSVMQASRENHYHGAGVPMLNIAHLGTRSAKVDVSHVHVRNLESDWFPQTFNANVSQHLSRSNFTSAFESLVDYDGDDGAQLLFQSADVLLDNVITTSAPSNITTIEPNITTTSSLPTVSPKPNLPTVSTAPDLCYVVMFPLAFFIVTSLIRNLRWISPFSTIATLALGVGAMSVFGKICSDFIKNGVGPGVNYWVHISTVPLFIGQLISAYEGIGCIIPIESSMEGNRWVFPSFLRASVYIVFFILTSFGVMGYLTYGSDAKQLVILNTGSVGALSYFIDITLIISVLFTYPLQCFPVIEITESYLFGTWRCCRRNATRLEYDEIGSTNSDVGGGHSRSINDDDDDETRGLLHTSSLEKSTSSMAADIPSEVPGWKRNIVRLILTLCIMGLAILCRNAYAYLGAFTGAVGCALLAYIIPCAIHLKVKHGNLSMKNLVKDWGTIIISICISILTLVVIIKKIVAGGVI